MEKKLAKFEDYIGDHFGQILLRGLQALIFVALMVAFPVLLAVFVPWLILLALAKLTR